MTKRYKFAHKKWFPFQKHSLFTDDTYFTGSIGIYSFSFIWSITFIDQLVASDNLYHKQKKYFLLKKNFKISLIHTNKPKQRSPNESFMRFSHGHHVIYSFHLMNHRIDCASIDSDALFSYWLECKFVILCSKHIIRTYSTPYSSKCV